MHWYQPNRPGAVVRAFLLHYLSEYDLRQTLRYCLDVSGDISGKRQLRRLVQSWKEVLESDPQVFFAALEELGQGVLYCDDESRQFTREEEIGFLRRIGDFLEQLVMVEAPAEKERLFLRLPEELQETYGPCLRLL